MNCTQEAARLEGEIDVHIDNAKAGYLGSESHRKGQREPSRRASGPI